MHFIEETFQKSPCCLYTDVLDCSRDATAAQLRKAYYRAAIKYHPDRSPNKNTTALFQAMSMAYELLKDPISRAEYDETGIIPDSNNDDTEETKGWDEWKHYFDTMFGKVTANDIDAFATKYKCSEEEQRDVLKQFVLRQGNLGAMMDHVMLSEPRDAERWVEDYIRPAMNSGELDKKWTKMMETSLKKCQTLAKKKSVQEDAANANESDDSQSGESESDEESPPPRKKAAANKKNAKQPPVKRKRVPAKVTNKKIKDMTDLVAAIQNKQHNAAAALGARYGVDMEADDPFENEDAFAKAQAKILKKKK
jgi:DnaJ family protein C protein 9